MKRYIKSSMERPYLYIFKHGLGPGTLPHDVNIVKTKDLPRGYTAVWTDRFLTTQEMDQYDIPYETEINRYLDRIGYCQKNGDVVPCTEDPYGFDDVIGSCGKKSVKAATDSNKYTIKSVSNDGTYYLVKDWRKNRELWVSKEKMDKHPEWWFTSSGKAKQSLKSLLSVMDEYLSDTFTVIDDSGNETPLDVKELGFDHIPDYEDDDVDACDKVTASNKTRYMANMVSADTDIDEEDFKYYVAGYFDSHLRGLDDNLATNDFDEALNKAHELASNGDYVEITNEITGKSHTYDPDEWMEAIEIGEVPSSTRDLW